MSSPFHHGELAVQARAGDQALMAARAWAETVPTSVEALQTSVQLLALMNKPAEVTQPLASLLRIAPVPQRPGLILALPRLFQRSPDPRSVLVALRPVLQAQTGALKPLAVTTAKRVPGVDLPTMAEAGLPGYETSTWGGILAPANTPKDVVAKLNAEFNKDLAQHDIKKKISDAVTKMEADGDWAKAFEKNLGPAGIATPTPPALAK